MDDSRFICPECKDTGIVYYNGENGYLYARPCKCRAVKEAKMRIERSGLAKLFKSKTFDSFKTYSDPILEDAKRTVMRFAETFESHGEEEANSLLLCGQVGAGKTHLGAACSMQLMDRGIPVVYMGYRDEMTSLKSKIIDEKAYSDTVNRFKTAKVLFIDDFIKGKTTESILPELRENIRSVLEEDTDQKIAEVDAAVKQKQAEFLDAGRDQEKIDEIGDAIMQLRDERQQILTQAAMRKDVKDRIEDLASFLDEQTQAVTEYSDVLVRRLIERITVYDEMLVVEFKSGLEIEVDA